MNTNSYFTVEFNSGNGVISLVLVNTGSDTEMQPIRYYYWKNTEPNTERDNYTGIITGGTGSVSDGSRVNFSQGDIVKLYRPETTAIGNGINNTNYFNGMSNCKIYGNLGSLIGFSETLPERAFQRLFYFCNFTDCSELEFPWTSVPKWGYRWMFYGCTKFSKIPNIKATSIGVEGCHQMFRQCIGIVNADLSNWNSITTVSTQSFQQLFFQCTAIESAIIPKLPHASLLWNGSFYGCSSLSEIKCLDTDTTSNNYNNWVQNISATGTFIKHPDATWSEGASGIPSGWTVKNMNPQTHTIDYSKVTAAYVKGNHSLSAIYGKCNILLWSKTQ